MSAYLAVVGARYRMLLQYRAAAFAGFATQLFWGAVKLMVLGAFYAVATSEQPMTFPQVVAYVWLGQALLGLIPWNVDQEIAEKMRTGAVAHELLRPLDLYAFWFARTFAFRTATTTLRMVPMIVVAMLVLPLVGLEEWRLAPPVSVVHGCAFLFSIALTVLLSAAVTMIMHVTMFWTLSHRGVVAMAAGLVPVLAGMVVPLPLFPAFVQPFLFWQPFRGLADVPFRIYSGNIELTAIPVEIALQAFWVLALTVAGYRLMALARHRLVVQGG